MAAYAALVSLMHIIEKIQHHPRPPISLEKKQAESLIEKVIFLQDFLEGYAFHGGNEEADGLQSRIADAAYVAEDIIESHVVDQILAQSTSRRKKLSSNDFYRSLQKVIEDMDFIKKVAMKIQQKMGIQDQLCINSMPVADSLISPSMGQNTMVGLDGVLIQLMDKLTGQPANRQIIPIVGMGGIGKTTLARNIYENPLIVEHFDIHAWVTISQEYSVPKILLGVLHCQKNQENKEALSAASEEELRDILYKSLWGRRYLIIMDDMWSIEAWDRVKFCFPDNNNGSRIMITTRLYDMALHINGGNNSGLEMNLLDEVESWNLLCKKVFGEEGCPLELEKIGKEIAKNCKGLPLSIVVIGGFLAKSKWTQEYWEYIAKNLNAIVNLEDDERCLKILYMSYNQLPVYLKPCFLYMGIFPEDSEIFVSELIKLWVVEGFLKPINDKSLEEVAEEYLKNLIDRNLILVHQWRYVGKIKSCKIHDLLRDMCLREGQKDKFIFVTSLYGHKIPRDIRAQRCIAIHQSTSEEEYSFPGVLYALEHKSLTRSLVICNSLEGLQLRNFRLLRVLKKADCEYSLEAILQLFNSRYLEVGPYSYSSPPRLPSSIHFLWNLQTLVIHHNSMLHYIAPSEIWKMSQLRHMEVNSIHLPDPPCGDGRDENFVLGKLQTLSRILHFKCGEEVVKRIPNIKKLKILYDEFEEGSCSYYCLNNLGRLHKLESLCCFFSTVETLPSRSNLLQNLTFPHSLKKLTLYGSCLHWEDMTTKIGSLPLLQVLKLRVPSFIGHEWETVEGQFLSLNFLQVDLCDDLENWKTESTHFPRLERLILQHLPKLKELPRDIGEIPMLKLIQLDNCRDSAIISAKEIVEEQEELGNVDLKVRVKLLYENEELESLASHNFIVERWA